jgi:ferredoxin/flavodoxin---NADP+ reductase
MSGISDKVAAVRSVAIVGAGPSGLYAAASLVKGDPALAVDVIDRLPTPYGLVRYGVAPDHANIKSVDRILAKPFSLPRVRFLGNVEIGKDLQHEDLMDQYDAVVYSTGSQVDRALDVPGEDLAGNVGSAQFVAWYSGHPDTATNNTSLDFQNVAIVGGGNVALDIARVLAKSPDELISTDIPDAVLATLRSSQVTDIHVLIRRGPSAAKFSYLELLSMGQLANASIVVHHDGRDPVSVGSQETPAEIDRVARNVQLIDEWKASAAEDRPRRIHLHFNTRILRIVGESRVTGVELAVGTSSEPDGVVPLPVGMVVRAVGYRSVALPGVPFDERAGRVPNEAGRVIEGGRTVPRLYVTGWLKRGPQGVIATNKVDATETARAVLEDLQSDQLDAPSRRVRSPAHLGEIVDWAGWLRIDAYEGEAGQARGAARVKHPDRASMLAIGRSQGG